MSNDFYSSMYNPDVLSCLANLSNDEVFTPPGIVNDMLDMLPKELWSNKNAKFLDPACKTGVFLREIAKRLLDGLESEIPDLQERIDHIFQNQIYGIAITELTSLLVRRSVYCSKYPNSVFSVSAFKDASGNIRFKKVQHRWRNGRCVFCGASESEYGEARRESLETHAYELIHTTKPEEILKMKFDVIIGNPPYQLNDGGSGTGISAKPLYHMFVKQALKLNPRYLTMIIPSRWFAGGKGLDEFRSDMINDNHIKEIVDYASSKDCFPGVNIAGGVCYFLWDRSYSGDCVIKNRYENVENQATRKLNEFTVFIRDNMAISIIRKVLNSGDESLISYNYTRNPFGFVSKERGEPKQFIGNIKLISSAGVGYVKRSDIKKNVDIVDKFKVTIGKVVPSNGEVDVTPKDGYRVTTNVRIMSPGEIHTESYLLLSAFERKNEAANFAKYMTLKLPRFLLKQTLTSMNISKSNFAFVPYLDFDREWTDNDLFERYRLDETEREFVNSIIRPVIVGDNNE